MAENSKLHLVERAAERLLRSGAVPASLGAGLRDGAESGGPAPVEGAPTAGATAELVTRPKVSAQPAAENGAGTPFGPADNGPANAGHSGPATAQPLPPASLDDAALKSAGLIDGAPGRNRALEELRLVQQQVLRAAFPLPGQGTEHANLLMVTSARPQEGKSFTALNLAASIARAGDQPVVLIDADPKQGCLSDALGVGRQPGLLELVLDPTLDLARVALATPLPRLSFLPVGQNRRKSAEAFASRQMARLLHGLSSRRPDHLLIVDASPCLSTSDPSTLAPLVGQTIFIVQAEWTQREEVEASLDLIQTCPSITLLLNKIQNSTRNAFGAYSYSYHS